MGVRFEGGNIINTNINVYYASNACTDYLNCDPIKATFSPGLYKIECWGASSDDRRGAYVKGKIYFPDEQVLYLYIGKKNNYFNAAPRTMSTQAPGYPGGATDIRINNGFYDSFDSLKSRIMVAGGSGGVDCVYDHGGEGGTLEGFTSVMTKSYEGQLMEKEAYSTGGTQTSGGKWINCVYAYGGQTDGINGDFGVTGALTSGDVGGVGGGGYYAGASRRVIGSGGGGSSFISGHKGCNAIFENSTEAKIYHSNQPVHYSGMRFGETVMKGGNETKAALHYNRFVNDGEGHIRITRISCNLCTRNNQLYRYSLLFISLMICLLPAK